DVRRIKSLRRGGEGGYGKDTHAAREWGGEFTWPTASSPRRASERSASTRLLLAPYRYAPRLPGAHQHRQAQCHARRHHELSPRKRSPTIQASRRPTLPVGIEAMSHAGGAETQIPAIDAGIGMVSERKGFTARAPGAISSRTPST